MNRRLLIFSVVFLVVCTAGLAYTFSIAPIYVATARIQVDPGMRPEQVQEGMAFVANEAQALTSNEIFQSVLAALNAKDPRSWSFASVPYLRDTLSASPSPGSNVIELSARGSQREQLALLLDTWTAAYLESRAGRRTNDRDSAMEEARTTAASVAARAAQKRRELEDFRRRHSIVSTERDENQAAARIRSLNVALNDARAKAIDAESRLSTLQAGVADRKAVYRDRDKNLIAQLEHRALDLRQKLTELDRDYTPQYLAMEPRAKALRANLQQLEQKIEDARRSSQQEMLNEASQEVVTARKNVARLEGQIADRQKDVLSFTSRFSEHQARAAELAQIESELSQAKQRVAMLERRERAREPRYELLGRPAVPEKPVHPDYALYAGFSVGGAVVFALLAVLLTDFLKPLPKPEAPAYPQHLIQIAYPPLPRGAGSEPSRLVGPMAALPASRHSLPAPVGAALRELTVGEVNALWDAATRDGRLAVAGLFSGLTLEELAALHWDEVDFDADSLHIRSPIDRLAPLIAPLDRELRARSAGRAGPELVAATSMGVSLSLPDLAGLVAAAAHDAGVEEAEIVDADTLRHTYVSFLVRQGVRLSELDKLVGYVAPAAFLHYRSLSPRGPARSPSMVELVHPAFRTL